MIRAIPLAERHCAIPMTEHKSNETGLSVVRELT
jgi:hypothetical protein